MLTTAEPNGSEGAGAYMPRGSVKNKVTCKTYPAIARTGTSESEVQRSNWTSIVFGGRGGEINFFLS